MKSKGISFGRLTAFPNGTLETSRLQGVDRDLRIRPFFAQGKLFSMREFLVGAFDAEMGLEAFDPDLLAASAGQTVTTPSGMVLSGSADTIGPPPARGLAEDPDGDGIKNEVPVSLVDHMEFYLLNYFKPASYQMTEAARDGLDVFAEVGCTSCHLPNLMVDRDRRVADVNTVYDPGRGIFNTLFATAVPRLLTMDDRTGLAPLKLPSLQPFLVKNIFADFKRHDLGPNFHERNFDGTLTREFMTEPLWGVGSTAPYGHDGRSINLTEVILRHGGEAQESRDRFADLSEDHRSDLISFLESLVLFPPDDTASTLNPGDPGAPGFPQKGHGSISLTVLFNNPRDPE